MNILLFFILISFMNISCSSPKEHPAYLPVQNEELSRPDPGYVQYMKKRSLLHNAEELINLVSASSHIWNADSNKQSLLTMADVWLSINPLLYITQADLSFFSSFSHTDSLQRMKDLGISGIYISPLYGTGYLWTNTQRMKSLGEDAVQYTFPNELGSLQEFMQFRNLLGKDSMFLGGNILPVATGIGADFWLATRSAQNYKGLYAINIIPSPLWDQLPTIPHDKNAIELSQETLHILSEAKIIPPFITQDDFLHNSTTGWALTRLITDVNGNEQQFLYRYFDNTLRPILQWNDPSFMAQRILNASIIQSVGAYGMALIGLELTPYIGLSPSLNATDALNQYPLFFSAVKSLSASISRFGAYSYVLDEISFDAILPTLERTDFLKDSITSPAAEFAILSGSTNVLSLLLRKALDNNIPFEKLVHTMPSEKGLSFYPLSYYNNSHTKFLSSQLETEHLAIINTISKKILLWKEYLPDSKQKLSLSTPALVALSASLPPKASILKNTQEYYKTIHKGHALLTLFKAMLPGILMLTAQDFSGTMPLQKKDFEQTGNTWSHDILSGYAAYSLQSSTHKNTLNKFGLVNTDSIYQPLDTQKLLQESYSKTLENILFIRKYLGISNSTLVEIFPTNTHFLSLLLKNKKNEFIIASFNFGQRESSFTINTKNTPELQEYLMSPHTATIIPLQKTLALTSPIKIALQAWEASIIHIVHK
ncbi:MAG: hypothetical protein ACRCV3_06085 [Desulfovibrionaceae bacterium]